ncbi:MAG: hypothetical protein NVS9B2_29330 [Steroidobacteraceae bacterium]
MQTLTWEQFRATNDAGGILSVTLKADGAGFELQMETRRGPATLVKARATAETRRFVDPRKALLLLRELGIREARMDTQRWQPDDVAFERKPRPDRAAALKATHAGYDEWLRAKLDASIADPRPRVPHADVMAAAQAIIDHRKEKARALIERNDKVIAKGQAHIDRKRAAKKASA